MKRCVEKTELYNIGIIGIDKGEGVTSLAVGLASYLQEMRCQKTALAEMNREGSFDDIRDTYFGKGYRENPFEIFKVDYYPGASKGQYARICNMGYQCIVTDFGNEYVRCMEDFLRCDKKVVIGSVNLWQYRKYLEFYEYVKNFPGLRNWIFVLSGDGEDIQMMRTKFGIKAVNKQHIMNPYQISESEMAYYELILKD